MLVARLDSAPMSLPDEISLRAAGDADLAGIADLRHSVGWGVHDWALRAVLVPPHARCFVAVDGGGRIVGVGSGISYGRFGVVGNMVVGPAHRRRGIGAAILEAVLAFLDECSVRRVELSATDAGRPLYARYGFVPTGPGVSAVVGRALPGADDPRPGVTLAEAGPDAVAELAAYDAPRFGGDRRPLLDMMLTDPERPVVVARRNGATLGWGWIRPEADRLGPLVADDPAVAMAIVAEAFRRIPAAPTLRLNLPAANLAGADALRAAGATFETWEGRMGRGPEVRRRDEAIYASAVGALG